MKVYVESDLCIACGACGSVAPDVFDYDDDGIAYNIIDDNQNTAEIPEDLHEDVHDASDSCPTDAIKITE